MYCVFETSFSNIFNRDLRLSRRKRRKLSMKNRNDIFWRSVAIAVVIYCLGVHGPTSSSGAPNINVSALMTALDSQTSINSKLIPSTSTLSRPNSQTSSAQTTNLSAIPSDSLNSSIIPAPTSQTFLPTSQNLSFSPASTLQTSNSQATSLDSWSSSVIPASNSSMTTTNPLNVPSNVQTSVSDLQTVNQKNIRFNLQTSPSSSQNVSSQTVLADLSTSPSTLQTDVSQAFSSTQTSPFVGTESQTVSDSEILSSSQVSPYGMRNSSLPPSGPPFPQLYVNDEKACRTGGCIATADFVTFNMDRKIDPCDNFYQFACGNFVKNAPISNDQGVASTFTLAASRVLKILDKTFKLPFANQDIKPYQLVKDYYHACMRDDKNGLEPIKYVLKQLGGWPVLEKNWNENSFKWTNTLYKFRKTGFDDGFFIRLLPWTNPKDPTTKLVTINLAQFGIPRVLLASKTETQPKEAYYKYMVEVAVLFGADRNRATSELKESFDFEIKLADFESTQHEMDTKMAYQIKLDGSPLRISLIQHSLPGIPLLEYINNILAPYLTLRESDVVFIRQGRYIIKLWELLMKTPKRVLANYLFWRAVHSSAPFLTKDVIDQRLTLDTLVYGNTKPSPKWKKCVEIIFDNLSLAATSLYSSLNIPPEDKKTAERLVLSIYNETLKIVNATAWMDETTKQKIKLRVDVTRNSILADVENFTIPSTDSEFLINYYSELEIKPCPFFMAYLNVSKFSADKKYSKFLPVSGNQTSLLALSPDPNEYENRLINNILAFTTIFQPPIFSSDRPRYLNFAQFGIIIGRLFTAEIERAAKTGFWSTEAENEFSQKAQCFVDKYNNYKIDGFDKNVNGTAIQTDITTIAGSIQIVYNAFFENYAETYGQERKLPGFENYTQPQMFWINAANLFCTKYTPQMLKTIVEEISHKHVPTEAIVVGLFSNVGDFTCDFNCKAGSKMNSPNKCKLWA